MARPRKIQPAIEVEVTTETGIKEILATSVGKTFEEAATYVNVANFKLRDMFCDRLGTDEPTAWETIPTEHEPLLEEFKRQMEAAATVKPYLPASAPQAQMPLETPKTDEIPILEETPKKGGKMTKRDSTAITAKQKKAIELELKAAKEAEQGVDKTQEIVALRNEFEKGVHQQKKQELAKTNGRLKVKEAAHKKFLLDIKKEAEGRTEEDIVEALKAAGIPTSEQTLADIRSFSEMALGKFDVIFQETLENPWTDGSEDSTAVDEFLTWNI